MVVFLFVFYLLFYISSKNNVILNRGVIQMHNETYIIQPMLGGDEGVSYIVVVFYTPLS